MEPATKATVRRSIGDPHHRRARPGPPRGRRLASRRGGPGDREQPGAGANVRRKSVDGELRPMEDVQAGHQQVGKNVVSRVPRITSEAPSLDS